MNFRFIKNQFKQQYKSAYKYSGCYFVFSFVKYLACFLSLQDRNEQCDINPIFVWLNVVGMYEFLNAIRYLTILYSLQTNAKDIFILVTSEYVRQALKLDTLEIPKGPQENELVNRRTLMKRLIKAKLQEVDHRQLNEEPPFSQHEIILKAEGLNSYTRIIRIYNQFVFYFLFVGGNAAYLTSDQNDCDKNIQKVTFALLFFGYLFSAFLIVGIGLAILSMSFYLPVVIFLFIIKLLAKVFNHFKLKVQLQFQDQQIKRKFQQIQKVIFEDSNDVYQQCLICMIDYQKGQQIIQLQCSVKHNFHQQCIHKWFEIKQQCPVCRKDL